jgi:hypothetical protein
MSRTRLPLEGDVADNKGFLLKRKDFLGVDELAHSHPNRTYYYKKIQDLDDIIDTCTKKLQVRFTEVGTLRCVNRSLFSARSTKRESIVPSGELVRQETPFRRGHSGLRHPP